MRMKFTFLIFFLAILGCSKNNEIHLDTCNECVVIDKDLYNNTKTNHYNIINVAVTNNLLKIKITSGGCSGNTWSATLVDANQVLESYPAQRNLKVLLTNKEDCLALVEKEFTFNISELKQNQQEIILNLDGWKTQINY